jgi:hypothetical protein
MVDNLTVEMALAELKEMFPSVMRWQISCYSNGDARHWRLSSVATPLIGGDSLTDCMAQIRKWKESTQ